MAAKPKTVFLIGIVAVAIAAIASISLYNYLKGQEAKVKEAVATEEIVVAAQEIPAGSAIVPAQVKTTPWPKGSLPQGTFPRAEDVSGRVALDRFTPGEPVIAAKLVPKEGQTGILSYKIPEGHRAMTVGVDQVSGVAGFITPGNKVDVVLTTTPPGAKQSISKIVLQDVPVLAIGQIVDQKEGKPVAVPTVTMDVTPDDAESLAIASTQGRLQLVLRRAGDAEVAHTVGATVTKVLSGTRVVKAERAPVRRAAVRKRPVKMETKKEEKREERREVKREAAKKPEEVISVELWKSGHRSTENFKVEE